MAKKDKPAKADKADSKAEKTAEREFKFGVDDIAEELGIKPASVRVQLRNKGIEKEGKSYGWNSKSDLKDVIDQIRSKDEDEKPKAKKASKETAKPAKTAKGKKAKPADDEDDD